MQGDFFAAEIT